MYKKSAQEFDHILEGIISHYSELIRAHGEVVQDFVKDYREIRSEEVNYYRGEKEKGINIAHPCLLALIARKRPVTTSQKFRGYQIEMGNPEITIIHLAKIQGKYYSHVASANSDGKYTSRRISKKKGLSINTDIQRDWIVKVIDQVNELNAISNQLKDHYVSSIEMHYKKHKYLTAIKRLGL